MKVTIFLTFEEVKEAILHYLEEHRPDYIEPTNDTKGPKIRISSGGKEIEQLTAEVEQLMDVHDGHHPYR